MRQGTFHPLSFLDQIFVSWTFIKNWVFYKIPLSSGKDEHFSCFNSSCQLVLTSIQYGHFLDMTKYSKFTFSQKLFCIHQNLGQNSWKGPMSMQTKVISSIFLLVVNSWNRQYHGKTIHSTEKFNSINLFKILCVEKWAKLFLWRLLEAKTL